MATESQILNTTFFFGAVADLLLNYITQNVLIGDPWGLRSYFERHGIAEAMCIAGGLMYVTMWLGLKLWGNPNQPKTTLFLFVFGAVVDFVLFRQGRMMPSLDGMYTAMSAPVSMAWAGGPLVMAYGLARFLS
jgi:hypothetical protein